MVTTDEVAETLKYGRLDECFAFADVNIACKHSFREFANPELLRIITQVFHL
jgi:hypothetical protein